MVKEVINNAHGDTDMSHHFDTAVNIAADNLSGAAVCCLAPNVDLLVSDRGETFAIWDHRPNAKRVEKPVTAAWAYEFLGAARGVTVHSFDW